MREFDPQTSPFTAVLVVEDHPLVLMTAVSMIEEAGLVAFAARDADEALAILSSEPDIGAMLTDLDMPGSMDGLALVLTVQQRWPHIRTLITSGGRAPDEPALAPTVAFYQKPYNPRLVIDALRAA